MREVGWISSKEDRTENRLSEGGGEGGGQNIEQAEGGGRRWRTEQRTD